MARARNTGMVYNADHSEFLETGTSPILLEPVQLSLKITANLNPGYGRWTMHGNRTPLEIEPVDGSWWLDGSENEAIYYLMEF